MKQLRSPKFLAIGVVAVGLLAIAFFVFFAVAKTPVLMTELLTTIGESKAESTFRMPSASTFHFVLALQKGPADYDENTRPAGHIEGEVLILEGTNLVVRVPVEHDNLQACNWLAREGFGVSYVLGWKTPRTLPKQLTAGHEYRLEARLQGVTNAHAGIWIHCAVPFKNRKSATGMKVDRSIQSSSGNN